MQHYQFDKLIFVMETKNDKPRLVPLTARKVTRGYVHGGPVRLRDAVESLEEGKRAILEGAPTSRQVAKMA